MQRQCSWFGCNAVASVTYTFDSSTCTVVLDRPFDGSARAGDLCNRHARSLKPPRGWHVEDRRPEDRGERDDVGRDRVEPAPKLVSVPDPEAELRTMLDVHSPLLERAFRSSGAG